METFYFFARARVPDPIGWVVALYFWGLAVMMFFAVVVSVLAGIWELSAKTGKKVWSLREAAGRAFWRSVVYFLRTVTLVAGTLTVVMLVLSLADFTGPTVDLAWDFLAQALGCAFIATVSWLLWKPRSE